MEIIVDLIILAIFAICLGLGFKKGLTGSLLKIISFILALVIAFLLFKPVSNFIVDHTNWDETLEQAIRQTLIEENSQENNQEENIEIQNGEGKEAQIGNEEKVKKQSMSEVMIDYINETIENATKMVVAETLKYI